MKRWITALGVVLTMTGGGCKGIVLDPLQSHPDGGADSGAGPGLQAISMRFGDWTVPTGSPPGPFDPQIMSQPHPDSLVLFFSDVAEVCEAPVVQREQSADPCNPDDAFTQILLIIPPELDRPGLIDLTDRRIFVYEAQWFASCGGGSGNTPGFRGTLEIVNSDANSVSVKLRVGAHQDDWTNLDGDYTVPRCGAAPPVPPPSSAIGIQGATMPAPPGGPAPDPTALYLVMGTAAYTCQDPWVAVQCTGTSRTVISIPPALQKPGIIDLTDPSVTVAYAESKDSAVACGQYDYVTGTLPAGTLEILSIDAAEVAYRIYGANTVPYGSFDADGLYTATICP